MAFSLEEQTLAVTVRSLTGTPHRLEDVSVLGSLPPLYPCPTQTTTQSGLNPEAHSLVLLLKVSSVEELQRCYLRIVVYSQEPPSLRGTALGELEVECGGRDWRAEHPFNLMKDLKQSKRRLKKVVMSCEWLSVDKI